MFQSMCFNFYFLFIYFISLSCDFLTDFNDNQIRRHMPHMEQDLFSDPESVNSSRFLEGFVSLTFNFQCLFKMCILVIVLTLKVFVCFVSFGFLLTIFTVLIFNAFPFIWGTVIDILVHRFTMLKYQTN